jgi:hypothetical protein
VTKIVTLDKNNCIGQIEKTHFSSNDAIICNLTCLLPWGIECMVNIDIVIEGHSISMYVYEKTSKALKIDGIYQCLYLR